MIDMETSESKQGFGIEDASSSEAHQDREHGPSPANLEVYKAVESHYRQDIVQFWTRSNFYLIIHAGLSSIIIASSSASSFPPVVEIAFEICGFLLAIAWFLVAHSSNKWRKWWLDQLLVIERSVDPQRSYDSVEGIITTSPVMRPSTVTLFVPVLFGLLWLTLLLVSFVKLFWLYLLWPTTVRTVQS